MKSINFHQKALLHVIVEAMDVKAGAIVILPNPVRVLIVLYQDVPGSIEDLRVQHICIPGLCVVVVKDTDFKFAQADLIVDVLDCWVKEASHFRVLKVIHQLLKVRAVCGGAGTVGPGPRGLQLGQEGEGNTTSAQPEAARAELCTEV